MDHGCGTNLVDQGMFLPSDIFPETEADHHQYHRQSSAQPRRPDYPSEVAYVEDLARKLAAFGLLDPNHRSLSLSKKPTPNLSPHLEGFRHENRFRYGGYEQETKLAMGGDTLYGHGDGGERSTRLRPVYPLDMVKPVSSQVGRSCYGVAGLMQRRQNMDHGRMFPVRLNRPRRECSGTGVFLPRIVNTHDSKNPGMKSRGEWQRVVVVQQQEEEAEVQAPAPMAAAAMGSGVMVRQGMSFQGPSESDLPQDWTYSYPL